MRDSRHYNNPPDTPQPSVHQTGGTPCPGYGDKPTSPHSDRLHPPSPRLLRPPRHHPHTPDRHRQRRLLPRPRLHHRPTRRTPPTHHPIHTTPQRVSRATRCCRRSAVSLNASASGTRSGSPVAGRRTPRSPAAAAVTFRNGRSAFVAAHQQRARAGAGEGAGDEDQAQEPERAVELAHRRHLPRRSPTAPAAVARPRAPGPRRAPCADARPAHPARCPGNATAASRGRPGCRHWPTHRRRPAEPRA